MIKNRTQPHFLSAVVFIIGLGLINVVSIFIGEHTNMDTAIFFGNTLGAGLLFPLSLLYIQRKEKFILSRYIYFTTLTTIAVAVLMYLFILRP